ncbi:glycoprotease family-domain-containing protein, partial [Catenaria anguillulae PL171]
MLSRSRSPVTAIAGMLGRCTRRLYHPAPALLSVPHPPASAFPRTIPAAPLRTPTPNHPLLILGIETSCDDTSVSLVSSDRRVRSLVTANQNKLHEPMGGVVPTNAAIAHSMNLPSTLRGALDQAGLHTPADLAQIDAVAVTRGPGLAPCLGVGLCAAKNLAGMLNKPLIGVHHMEAHALTPRLTEHSPPQFPYLSLLVSGGHTMLILTRGLGSHQILGSTLDDAVGEAFDKTARALGLKWLNTGGGAGAALERAALAATGQHKVRFSVPLRDGRDKPERRMCFSFSGLKTAVQRHVDALPAGMVDTEAVKADVAFAFQTAAVAHLEDRLRRALGVLVTEQKVPVTAVVVAGGVAANKYLASRLGKVVENEFGLPLMVPPAKLCTDNAAMIAWVGVERYLAGKVDAWETDYVPKWPLSELTEE